MSIRVAILLACAVCVESSRSENVATNLDDSDTIVKDDRYLALRQTQTAAYEAVSNHGRTEPSILEGVYYQERGDNNKPVERCCCPKDQETGEQPAESKCKFLHAFRDDYHPVGHHAGLTTQVRLKKSAWVTTLGNWVCPGTTDTEPGMGWHHAKPDSAGMAECEAGKAEYEQRQQDWAAEREVLQTDVEAANVQIDDLIASYGCKAVADEEVDGHYCGVGGLTNVHNCKEKNCYSQACYRCTKTGTLYHKRKGEGLVDDFISTTMAVKNYALEQCRVACLTEDPMDLPIPARRTNKPTVDELLEEAKHSEYVIRQFAAEALGEAVTTGLFEGDRKAALDGLVGMAKETGGDTSAHVRAEAVGALGKIGAAVPEFAEEAVASITAALQDSYCSGIVCVREAAAKALGSIGIEASAAIDPLLEAMETSDADESDSFIAASFHKAASEALQKMGLPHNHPEVGDWIRVKGGLEWSSVEQAVGVVVGTTKGGPSVLVAGNDAHVGGVHEVRADNVLSLAKAGSHVYSYYALESGERSSNAAYGELQSTPGTPSAASVSVQFGDVERSVPVEWILWAFEVEPTTESGCTCKGLSVKGGKCKFRGEKYAWCETQNGCGKRSGLSSHWDKCTTRDQFRLSKLGNACKADWELTSGVRCSNYCCNGGCVTEADKWEKCS